MNKSEDYRQQLWEYVYGLLSEKEEAEIERLVTSDPDVSRMYAEVKLETELLAKAAKLEDAPVELKRPSKEETRVQPAGRNASQKRQSARGIGWVNWLVGLSAAALVGLLGYNYLRPQSPINASTTATAENKIARQHVRTVITGPAKLQRGVTNYFNVLTTDVTGTGQSSQIKYRLYDTSTGQLKLERHCLTDDEGQVQLDLPAQLVTHNARFEVETLNDNQSVSTFQTHLKVDRVRHVTHLSVDRPLYRPGETVYFRSLTLSRFGMQDDRNMAVLFEILDPAGTLIQESKQVGYTQRGVGNGAFTIAPGRPGGTYTLVARGPNEEFPEVKREFMVRAYRTPRLKKLLEFTRDSYAPGDEVIADVSATRAEGGPAAGAKLNVQVTIDKEKVPVEPAAAVAGADGTYQIKFQLPKRIEKGAGTLAVIIDDGGNKETVAKSIPINLGKVEISFYPEGGDLVAGLENRVYLHAVDPLGKPVHVSGRIVDSKGALVTKVETKSGSEGRATFRFTPAREQTYHLEIDEPAGVLQSPQLPAPTADAFLVMDTAGGVFAADTPIKLEIRSKKDVPLVVSAVCRGAQVGQQQLKGNGKLSLTLAKQAAGVIRVTVYDYSNSKPKPVAERLVYRRPAGKLNVRVADHSEAYSPGEKVKLSLLATTEDGKPAPAVLGVRVVDDALLNLADDKSAAMPTNFLLASEIEKPEDLEDVNFFLGEEEEAEQALDLLLGTQGWRRFADQTLGDLVKSEDANEDSKEDEPLARLVAMDDKAGPPLVADNLADVKVRHSTAVSTLHRGRGELLNEIGRILLISSLAVVGLLVLTMLLRLTSGARVWMPAMATAGTCLVLGYLWMGARIDHLGEIALTPFATSAVQQERVSELDAAADSTIELHIVDGQQHWDVNGNWNYRWGVPMADEARELIENEMRLWQRFDGGKRLEQGLGLDFGADDGFQFGNGLIDLAAEGNAVILGGIRGEALGWNKNFDVDGIAVFEDLQQFGLVMGDEFIRRGRFFANPGRPQIHAEAGGGVALYELAIKEAARRGDVEQVMALADQLKSRLDQIRFPVRQYAHSHKPAADPGVRSDFAETLFWHPLLIADKTGRASVEFDLSDSVTTFRVLTDAHGAGRIGTGDAEIVSRIPFSLEPKLPLEVNAGDRIDLPLAINNDTKDKLPVSVTFEHGNLLELVGDAEREIELAAATRHREHYSLNVVGHVGQADIEFRGLAGMLSDGIKRSISVVPPGFPIEQSWAGKIGGEQKLTIELPESWVPGSLDVRLSVFPSTLADLQEGIAGILREPSGCFEQTSSANYPNILALRYMQEHDVANPEFTSRAKDMLKRGYGKLTSFECSQKGYEWFGGDPGHEALTAYGLMEFQDMAAVYDVDQDMVTRTAKWLLDRRDGKGGFTRNPRALDSFGGAPQDITDAYIVWALSETHDDEILAKLEKEIDHVIELADKSEDPYLIALIAAAACNVERVEGAQLLAKLAEFQQEDGHLEGKDGTITRSGGISRKVETTALAAIAWLKRPEFVPSSNKAIEWITKSRQGAGGFGSTQATILALKALIENAKANRKIVNDGELILHVDGVEVARTGFKAGATQAIRLENVAQHLKPGKNELTIKLTGDNEMPYAVGMEYRTPRPVSSEACPVELSARLAADKVKAGDTVGLWMELENTSGEGQPMTLAIVGLPAGLEARQEQLEELKDAGKFDYYELRARELIFYWRSLGPEVTGDKKHTFNLDLIAEIPGKYTGPASRTYLYYTAEEKNWSAPLEIAIER